MRSLPQLGQKDLQIASPSSRFLFGSSLAGLLLRSWNVLVGRGSESAVQIGRQEPGKSKAHGIYGAVQRQHGWNIEPVRAPIVPNRVDRSQRHSEEQRHSRYAKKQPAGPGRGTRRQPKLQTSYQKSRRRQKPGGQPFQQRRKRDAQ